MLVQAGLWLEQDSVAGIDVVARLADSPMVFLLQGIEDLAIPGLFHLEDVLSGLPSTRRCLVPPAATAQPDGSNLVEDHKDATAVELLSRVVF